jgi:serine/threonine-protein kinase
VSPDGERTPGSKQLRRNAPGLVDGTIVAGRYQIGARIGSGGMGVVHAAVEISTGREVAIKALNATAFTTENLRRFRREARTAASVKHRHVCAVHYLGVEAGTPFIVMERLTGETLRRRLSETGPTSAADAITIMLQLLEGLSVAHAAGVLHRDIKPGNIFITTPRGDSPAIKIIDFGLAKLLPATAWKPRPEVPPEELSAITTTDVIPGTPFYLAPEQVAGSRNLDERVDVWAAGLTLYEMLSGKRAHDAPSYVDLVSEILLRPLPPLSSFRSDLPVGLDAVLDRAIAKDRANRYSNAKAFRAALTAEWALFRTAGVTRGRALRKHRPEALTLPAIEEASREEMTEVNVHVEFDPGD